MIKTERRQIHFLSDVFVAVASLNLKVPNIRAHADIVRLRLPCSPSLFPVLLLYADDTSAIVSTDSPIRATFDSYTLFEKGSTSQLLNLSMCEGMWLGAWHGRTDSLAS